MLTRNRIGLTFGLGLILALGGACDNGTGVGTSEQICDDGVDNDEDGLVDCHDPDCAGNAACDGVPESRCADGVDNDDDGAVDCADSDCDNSPDCREPETNCTNGLDDDGDLLIDCNDSDCLANPDCEGQIETECADGLDDDGDGLIDCNDPNCREDAACVGQIETNCTNTEDDDEDGLVDCADPNCLQDPACAPVPPETNCTNQIDDDEDGFTDCADPDCALAPNCQAVTRETQCDNQTDDDNDGAIDCADSDCVLDPACAGQVEALCNDTADNDQDGAIDCADSDCANYPGCGGDGLTCGQIVVCMQSCTDMNCMYEDCINQGCPTAQAAAEPLTNCVMQSCGMSCQAGVNEACMTCIQTSCSDELAECAADTCATPETEIDCTNGVDDDGDGLTDCDDVDDCSADPVCNGTALTCGEVITCAQSCADYSCIQACQEQGCPSAQTLSNDLLQCMMGSCGADCFNDPSGAACMTCVQTNCSSQMAACYADDCSGGGSEICNNGSDDDGDGAVDCADSDCAGSPDCPGTELTCGELLDCLASCADQACRQACNEAACDTAVQAYADIRTCRMAECQTECPQGGTNTQQCRDCIALNCPDEVAACEADTCVPVPTEWACDNGDDDDGDGDTDCDDTDCMDTPTCTGDEYTCSEILSCREGCGANQTCVQQCVTDGCDSAEAAYQDIVDCTVEYCATQCAADPASMQCRACIGQNCTTEIQACTNNTCP